MADFRIFKQIKNEPKACVNTLPALTKQPNKEAVMAKSKVCNSNTQYQEIWKPVQGFEGRYEISNKGRIKSFYNKFGRKRERPIILKTPPGNYKQKTLCKGGVRYSKSIHRLVAETFLENPENKREVNHKNGDPSDNRITNLEWVTSSENTVHSYKNNLQGRGENFYSSKLTENEAIQIINSYNLGVFSQKELSVAYNVSKSTIKDLLSGRNWAHLRIQKRIANRCDRVVQYS